MSPRPPKNWEQALLVFGNPAGYSAQRWVKRMVEVVVPWPTATPILVHRLAADAFKDALRDIESQDLGSLIVEVGTAYEFPANEAGPFDYHTLGAAIDLNKSMNPDGQAPTDDQLTIISVFVTHGFTSGANFSPTLKPSHLQYGAGWDSN